jgi:hypothetical protein
MGTGDLKKMPGKDKQDGIQAPQKLMKAVL